MSKKIFTIEGLPDRDEVVARRRRVSKRFDVNRASTRGFRRVHDAPP